MKKLFGRNTSRRGVLFKLPSRGVTRTQNSQSLSASAVDFYVLDTVLYSTINGVSIFEHVVLYVIR
jgi:hypothetical protein